MDQADVIANDINEIFIQNRFFDQKELAECTLHFAAEEEERESKKEGGGNDA